MSQQKPKSNSMWFDLKIRVSLYTLQQQGRCWGDVTGPLVWHTPIGNSLHTLATLQLTWWWSMYPLRKAYEVVCIVTCLCTSVYYVYMRRALYCVFTCWHTAKYKCLHNCIWAIYMHLNKILPSKTYQYMCIHLNTRYTCGPRSACMVVLYVSHVSATTSVNKSRLVETGGGV